MNLKRSAAVFAGLLAVAIMLCAFVLDVDNKDKVAIFNNIDIPADMTVRGDAVAIFGNITVEGELTGDAVSILGNVEVSGSVDGDVVAVMGNVSAKGNGVISGDAVGILGGVDKIQNAEIKGEIADISNPVHFGKRGFMPRISYGGVVGLFVMYAFSCLAVLAAPDRIRRMSAESKEKMARRFGIGFAAMLAFIPAAAILSVVLAITVIGIVFIPFIFIAFILLAFVGMVALEIAIGHRITGELEGRNSLFIHLLVGVIIVYVVKVIPVLGWLLYLGLVAIALGVAIDTKLGTPTVRKQVPND